MSACSAISLMVFSMRMNVDHNTVTVVRLHHGSDDAYWCSRTPEERMRAIQTNRIAAYGYERATARLHRVLEISRRSPG